MVFFGKIAAAVFAWGAYAVLRLVGWKRKTVFANVKHVAGALSNALNVTNAPTIAPVNYDELLINLTRHVGELLFCFGTFKRLPADFSKYPCRVDGWDFALDEAAIPVLEKMRSGGIFLTAHYGNYEAMGPWLCRLGIPLVASYIPVKPKWLNNILERKIRAVDGRSYSVDARTPRDFIRILNEGKLFCLLSDQDSRIPSALPGTFLGRPANVNPLPDFLLKHRPQTPVFICWMEERGASPEDASLKCASLKKVRVLHAIEVEGPRILEKFNKWLEERIYENPNLWYSFTHRRFYSQSPEIYNK
ncbi:lysophospholipid acyltransferase family protein [Fibrobacter sp. UWB13]|uniref:lysophospholipid acyltransferase family protein n=1 Tax=Fibrobacter sp. UWB13 TaxID=1896204 RepID=UPI000A0D4076|nr:lysophospholipid acyltransferase family protein [Fibrobacter sp. UWB13]SMG21063.1 KDO2-lipid IV(A) lauroyltransferase [Fibrobacter sp. UWB13]